MRVFKNDNIRLKIDALTSQGSGIGRYDGFAVFVRGTVAGDLVDAHIIKSTKTYAVGVVNKIITPSENRIESDCTYSSRCGGCSFRNITYDGELEYKKNRVQDAVSRIGESDVELEEIIGAKDTLHYRNKAQYPVSIVDGELLAGFYAYKSHRIIPCDDCLLQPKEFKCAVNVFKKWAKQAKVSSYDESTQRGLLRHIYLRKGFATGEIMACAVINGADIPEKELLISLLRDNVNGLKSVVININRNDSNVVLGSVSKTIWGEGEITDRILGKTFVISPNSFYQVNPAQCERLYEKAAEFAGLTGSETLVDLYCGVGTIGLTMADRAKEVIGMEIVPSAVENAKRNAEINNIKNARFICADASDGAKALEKEGVKPDVVVIDPPRKGCDSELIETICKMSPERIVYVSCDSATLARDIKIYESEGYKAKRLCAVDMFPRTPHVEAVALLGKR